MKNYEMEVKHDGGKVVVRTSAESIEAAMQGVEAAEGCPRSAIGWWRVIPTARQIAKTKSMLRGL